MPGPEPIEIEAARDGGLRIVWDDGHTSPYSHPALRYACPCAMCVDEWSGERRLRRTDIQPGIRPEALDLVGNYALQITWSDGHSSGIYTFERLRELCECPDCSRK